MKTKFIFVLIVFALVSTGSAFAADSILGTVADGCKEELTTYCEDVTPGDGRILACLYSRSDKLSGKCEFALYDAAVQLERAVAALSYVVNECADDLSTLCAGVEAGEGRLLECLDKQADKVSDRCKDAVKTVAK